MEEIQRTQIKSLKDSAFDMLIVGGGSTGAGLALDAASRGYSVALIDKNDFASGTSSKSTKLLHGGIRYLEQAVLHLDAGAWHVVNDSLAERKTILEIAPELTRRLPLIVPVYSLSGIPYYWFGVKAYELLARGQSLGFGCFLSKRETLERFPWINTNGLRGGILFYDGQFDDVRMVVSLVRTASAYGGIVANYVELLGVSAPSMGLQAALARDRQTGEEFTISAKVIVNAAGPYVDAIRSMGNLKQPIIAPSSGVHLVVAGKWTHSEAGVIVPKTKDGRVLFVLPWKGHTLIGTTDRPCTISCNPLPTTEEMDELLSTVQGALGLPIRHSDILAAWSGIRPLIRHTPGVATASMVRDYFIERGKTPFYTAAGGKWTTYRKMAEDVLDKVIANGDLKAAGPCRTKEIKLICNAAIDFPGAPQARSAENSASPIVKGYPYIESDVVNAIQSEFACTPLDIVARRLHLALLNTSQAHAAIPQIASIMGSALGWSAEKVRKESEKNASLFLESYAFPGFP